MYILSVRKIYVGMYVHVYMDVRIICTFDFMFISVHEKCMDV